MATDYALAWPTPPPVPGLTAAQAAECERRKRHAPGLWAQRLDRGPCQMPPGFTGVFTTCQGCPYACCEKCPPNDAWTEFHALDVETKNAHRRSWWQRITGHKPQEVGR